ncbi:MAG TPA: hypothetical protein VNO34_09075 [Actinomycetota bacterium]|nr:hypothetical protein [Actinomycetota bacterium]
MKDSQPTVTEAAVGYFLRAASLQVPEGRHALLAEQLAALFDDANELSRKVAERPELVPAVRFHHPETGFEERE